MHTISEALCELLHKKVQSKVHGIAKHIHACMLPHAIRFTLLLLLCLRKKSVAVFSAKAMGNFLVKLPSFFPL